MPHVTTVLPVYNAAAYLPAALRSLAAQSRRPDRIVVLDDCSTDDTVRIAAEFNLLACEVVRNASNLGLFPNHNRALACARDTDFLHLLHGDDAIYPTFYERMLAAQAGLPGRTIAFCAFTVIDQDGVPLRHWPVRKNRRDRIVPVKSFLARQSKMQPVLLHGVLLKTGRQAAPCQFRLDLPQVGDLVFHAEWAKSCDTIVEVRETLIAHRVHAHSASSRNRMNLKFGLTDDWTAMTCIAGLIEEPRWLRSLRRRRLALQFAMLAKLKIKVVRSDHPAFARQLRDEAVRIVGRRYWLAGQFLALLRSVAIRFRLLENSR